MALVVFLPRPESIVYRIFILVHFIPQYSSPRPVGTGGREASLAPLLILYTTGTVLLYWNVAMKGELLLLLIGQVINHLFS